MDERERRLAKNEALFRDVNERIQAIAAAQGSDAHQYEFVCECSNIDCALRVRLTLATYERARSDSTVFLTAPGHELPEIDNVIFRCDDYQLVRKFGEAAELAKEQDPRG